MKKYHTSIFVLLAFLMAGLLPQKEVTAQQQSKPVLTVAILTNVSSTVSEKSFQQLNEYLNKKLNAKIELIKPQKTLDLVEMLKEGKVDIAIMNTFGYVLASGDKSVEPLLVIANKNQKPISYQSCIIVNPDSLGQMKNIEDIKRLSHNIDFMFVNSGSTSGHLVPRLYLAKEKINPAEMFFKSIVFGGTHQNTVMAIKEGKAFAGSCSYDELHEMIDEKKLEKDAVRVIWISEPIFNSPITVRKTLAEAQKEAIKQAFMDLPTKEAKLYAEIKQLWHNTAQECTFVQADDQMYDSVRKMADSVDYLALFVKAYANQ